MADHRNRIDGAREEARKETTTKMAESLLNSGMTISEIAKHTTYTKAELKKTP